MTGNPLVLRMVVNYSRQMSSQNALRDIVGPLIMKVIEYTSEFFPVFDELRNNSLYLILCNELVIHEIKAKFYLCMALRHIAQWMCICTHS